MGSDSSEDSEDLDDDYDAFNDIVNPLEGCWLPRSCVTYIHDGNMLGNIDSTSRDVTKHWNNIRAATHDFDE